mgnify:CR=1 FL=1
MLVIEFKIECNRNYIGKDNLKFLCIKIKEVYNIPEIKMIILKSKLKNNWRITSSRFGKYQLKDYPHRLYESESKY